MKIVVCIKQVPDTTNVRINPETNTLIREGVESIINPFDMYAIEEGLRLREKFGGTVTVMSMGPPQVETSLKEAVSLGADEVILLSDRAFAGADTLATAYTLAAGIRKMGGVDIILMGKQAIDGDTGQVGPGVAEQLDIPHVTEIRKIEEVTGLTTEGASPDKSAKITVERLLENGYLRLRTALPVILTVVKEINEPRLPSLKGKMRAKSAAVPVWKSGDLDIDGERIGMNGSPTQVMKIFTPPKPAGGKIYNGNIAESVASLITELQKAGLRIGKKKDS